MAEDVGDRGLVRAAQVLAGNPGTIAQALAEYNRVRLPDIDALHTLDRAGDRLFGAGESSPPSWEGNERVLAQLQGSYGATGSETALV